MGSKVHLVFFHIVMFIVTCAVAWSLIEGWFWDFWEGTRQLFQWAEPFAPFSTSFVAILAGIVAWLTYRHRRKADDREYEHRRTIDDRSERWKRVQSAIDLATADIDKIGRSAGLSLLRSLAADPDIEKRELELLLEIIENLLAEYVEEQNILLEESREVHHFFLPRWLTRIPVMLGLRKEDGRL